MQVGPDCTWVKSRIFTPSSALPAWPNGFALGRGRPLPAAFAAGFFAFRRTTFAEDFFAAIFLTAAFLTAGLDFVLAFFFVAMCFPP